MRAGKSTKIFKTIHTDQRKWFLKGQPGRVTNNDSEIANLLAQQHQNFLKLPLQECVPKMQEFTESLTRIRQKAMFSLDNDSVTIPRFFSPFSKTRLDWERMSEQQRRAHVEKVFPESLLLGEPYVESKSTLSVSWQQAGMHYFRSDALKMCWEEAEQLIAKGCVAQFSCGGKFSVLENKFPLVVEEREDGGFMCSSVCRQKKTFGGLVCSHVIAAAEVANKLSSFVDFCHSYHRNNLNKSISAAQNANAGKKNEGSQSGRRPQLNPVSTVHSVSAANTNTCDCAEHGLVVPSDAELLCMTVRPSRTPNPHYWQNNNVFKIRFLKDVNPRGSRKCMECRQLFEVDGGIPDDICLAHKELYAWPVYHPVTGKVMHGGQSTVDQREFLVHARYQCVKPRYPSFWNGLLEISPEDKVKLTPKHKAHIGEMFALSL